MRMPTYDPDQLLVWHFAGDSALAHDSTGYGNNALTPTARDEAGIIGFGAKFGATTPPIKLAPSASLNVTAGETYTWQVWEKAAPVTQTSVVFEQHDAASAADLQIGFAAGAPYVLATPAAGAPVRAQAGAPVTGDGWHLLTMTANADRLTLFVDGVKVGEAAGGLPAIEGAAQLGGPRRCHGRPGFSRRHNQPDQPGCSDAHRRHAIGYPRNGCDRRGAGQFHGRTG